jgi:hypothetical protein
MKRILFIFVIVLLLAALVPQSVQAADELPPALPSSFYGQVSIMGRNVAPGTAITALIDGKVVATTKTIMWQGKSVYSLDVAKGAEGKTIRFKIGGSYAWQTAIKQSGTNKALNLFR